MGLTRTTEEAKYREGGMNETVQKSAGLTEFPDITLKRGQIIGSSQGGDDDFLNWATQVFDVSAAGNATNYRQDIDIQQYSAQNVLARVWTVYNTWPKEYKPMSDQKGDSNDNNFEELKLANEGWDETL
jgi:phage tail-like protein